MPDHDHLSLHEQQTLAEEERYRQKGVVPFLGHVRPKPTAAQETEAARLNAVRALPDTLFDDDPMVQHLRARLRTKTALIEKRIQVRNWLAQQMARLDEDLEEAERIVQDAILDDAAAGDAGFAKTREAIASFELAKAVRASSDAAYAMVAPSDPSAQCALYDARDAARTALNEHLFALKQAYMNDQAQAGQVQEGGA